MIHRLKKMPSWARWMLGVALGLAGVVALASWFVDEPLRRYMEGELNRRLEGYTVQIGALDFHPIGFSLDLERVVMTQDANPDPPVATVPRLSASVQWSQIVFGRLVANFSVEDPTLYINRTHLGRELDDGVALETRGWQEALQAIYPLKINEFKITGATLTYVDDAGFPPLHLSHVTLRAGNIRNIRAPERTYPSTIEAEAVIFGTGRASVQGHADFLATPHPGVRAEIAVDAIPLHVFAPILRRYGVTLRGGSLAATGSLEYAPQVRVVELAEATLSGVRADYTHGGPGSERARTVAREGKKLAKEVKDDPQTLVRVARFRLLEGEVGYVNRERPPGYRVFVSEARLEVTNLTNHQSEGTAQATLTGRFMGSGPTRVQARFRPAPRGADFSAQVQIDDTDLRTMNDLLRAHGKFDVVGGVFSLYTEVRVKDNEIRGYVKPLFRDVQAYDPAQDRHKSLVKKLYERAVEGAAKLLENQPRDEVVTKVELSGRVENPDAGTLAAVLRLVQNAFFRAILPGFEGSLRRSSRT